MLNRRIFLASAAASGLISAQSFARVPPSCFLNFDILTFFYLQIYFLECNSLLPADVLQLQTAEILHVEELINEQSEFVFYFLF